MDSENTERALEEQAPGTPDDVAVLYSWANLHGAKYRDFSASRREYRAQMRHRAAEQQLQIERQAQADAEALAAREEAAAHAAEAAAANATEAAAIATEAAARKVAADRAEAIRHAEAAAAAEAAARRAEIEMAAARIVAQQQAARYAESDSRRRALAGPQPQPGYQIPGQISDPYDKPVHQDLEALLASSATSSGARAARTLSGDSSGAIQAYRPTRPTHPLPDSAPHSHTEQPPVPPVFDAYRVAPPPAYFPEPTPRPRTPPPARQGYRPDVPTGQMPAYVPPPSDDLPSAPSRQFIPIATRQPAPYVDPLPKERSPRDRGSRGQESQPGRQFIPATADRPLESTPATPAPRKFVPEVSMADETSQKPPEPARPPTVPQYEAPSPRPYLPPDVSGTAYMPPAYKAQSPRSEYLPDPSRDPAFNPRSSTLEPRQPPADSRPAWLYTGQEPTRPAPTTSPVADTLQHSRERVAARWFALKGVFDNVPQEQPEAAPVRQKELRTPTLAVFSMAGGVGKTSMVATLGRALSSMGEKVLLTDTTSHGLLPFYFGARELRPGVVRTFSPPSGSTDAPIYLVNYEVEQMQGDQAAQDWLVEEITRNSRGTHRVLLDISGASGWVTRRLARMSPTVLVPLAPDMNSVISLQSVEKFFHGVADADGRPVQPYFLLNQFDQSLPLHLDVREVMRQQLGDRLLPFAIRRAPAVSEALAEGMTVIDYAPGTPVSEDYMDLAGWLRNVSAPATAAFRGVRWSER